MSFTKRCFVCHEEVNREESELNLEINLPVCNNCKGTVNEKKAVDGYLIVLQMA